MTTTSNGGADLQALMVIADRYARRLAMDPDAPSATLLLERSGALDIVTLGDEGQDVLPSVRLLLARSGASSAVLLVETPATSAGTNAVTFWIVGESIEGAFARRRYRIRPCGRGRRLTLVAGDDAADEAAAAGLLFPVHVKPEATEDAATTTSSVEREHR